MIDRHIDKCRDGGVAWPITFHIYIAIYIFLYACNYIYIYIAPPTLTDNVIYTALYEELFFQSALCAIPKKKKKKKWAYNANVKFDYL